MVGPAVSTSAWGVSVGGCWVTVCSGAFVTQAVIVILVTACVATSVGSMSVNGMDSKNRNIKLNKPTKIILVTNLSYVLQ